MSYVQTSRESRFGGLILPQETLASMIRDTVSGLGGGAWESTRPTNKNLIGWDLSAGSANADTLPYADDLRYQSRDLYRNNPLAGGALRTLSTNVVGTGLLPQSMIDTKILGLSDDAANEWQSDAERYFFLWAASQNADIRRTLNFWQMQDLVFLTALMSGDAFTIRRFKERSGSLFGVCLQVVEGDRCASPWGSETPSDHIRGGVEMDDDGAPIRYHFLQEHPGETLPRSSKLAKWTSTPAFDENGMRLTLHHYEMDRPEQARGVPYLAPVVEALKQLGRYTEAEITAAVVSGMFSVMVKTETPSGMAGALPGGIPGQVGGVQMTPPGTGLTRLQSGMIMDLAPGESIEVVNPNRPNTAFDPFVMAVMRQISARLELPLEVLVKHFTASYSASRGALLEAWKTYRRRRAWLVASLCQPVWEWVISEAVARGYLDAPGFFDNPLRRAAWLGCSWTGSPMGQLDPLKEAKAATEWMNNKATTLQRVTAEYFGDDYEDNLRQIARERTMIAALPADPNAPPAPAAAGSGAGDRDEEREE